MGPLSPEDPSNLRKRQRDLYASSGRPRKYREVSNPKKIPNNHSSTCKEYILSDNRAVLKVRRIRQNEPSISSLPSLKANKTSNNNRRSIAIDQQSSLSNRTLRQDIPVSGSQKNSGSPARSHSAFSQRSAGRFDSEGSQLSSPRPSSAGEISVRTRRQLKGTIESAMSQEKGPDKYQYQPEPEPESVFGQGVGLRGALDSDIEGDADVSRLSDSPLDFAPDDENEVNRQESSSESPPEPVPEASPQPAREPTRKTIPNSANEAENGPQVPHNVQQLATPAPSRSTTIPFNSNAAPQAAQLKPAEVTSELEIIDLLSDDSSDEVDTGNDMHRPEAAPAPAPASEPASEAETEAEAELELKTAGNDPHFEMDIDILPQDDLDEDDPAENDQPSGTQFNDPLNPPPNNAEHMNNVQNIPPSAAPNLEPQQRPAHNSQPPISQFTEEPHIVQSIAEVAKFIEKTNEIRCSAVPVRDFLKDKNRLNKELENDSTLNNYIICFRKQSTSPDSLPESIKRLSAGVNSIPEFLARVWNHKFGFSSGKQLLSSMNAASQDPLWSKLAHHTGKDFTLFVILYTVVLKTSAVGMWYMLWRDGDVLKLKTPIFPYRKASGVKKLNIVTTTHRPTVLLEKSLNITSNWREELNNPKYMSLVEQEISRIEARMKKSKVPLFVNQFRTTTDGNMKEVKSVSPRFVATSLLNSAESVFGRKIIGSSDSNPNRKQLRLNLTAFLKCPANACFTRAQMVRGIDVKQVTWFNTLGSEELSIGKKEEALCQIMEYLFARVFKSLLYHNYHYTQMSIAQSTECKLFHIVFWYQTVASELFSEISSYKHARECGVIRKSKDTDPTVRFAPKKSPDNFRLIVNLKEYNKTTLYEHFALSRLIQPDETCIENTHDWMDRIYSFIDFHRKETKLINENRVHPLPEKPMYMVRSDIKGCYASSNPEMVLKALDEVLGSNNRLFRISETQCHVVNQKSPRKIVDVSECPGGNILTKSKSKGKSNGIVYPAKETNYVSAADIKHKCANLLGNLFVKFNKEESVKLKHGIPEGSNLSLDLCNIVLDKFVNEELKQFKKDENSLLLRYVDDFLFLTTDLILAEKYLATLKTGFKDSYGYEFKENKMLVNYGPQKAPKIKFLGVTFDENLNVHSQAPDFHPVEYDECPPERKFKLVIRDLNRCTAPLQHNTGLDSCDLTLTERKVASAFNKTVVERWHIIQEHSPAHLGTDKKKLNYLIDKFLLKYIHNSRRKHIQGLCFRILVKRVGIQPKSKPNHQEIDILEENSVEQLFMSSLTQ